MCGCGKPETADCGEFEAAAWTQLHPVLGPPWGDLHFLAYDSTRGVTVLFGGYDGWFTSDTWEWDGETWTQRLLSGVSPRDGQALVFDSARAISFLFGEWGTGDESGNERWEYAAGVP